MVCRFMAQELHTLTTVLELPDPLLTSGGYHATHFYVRTYKAQTPSGPWLTSMYAHNLQFLKLSVKLPRSSTSTGVAFL